MTCKRNGKRPFLFFVRNFFSGKCAWGYGIVCLPKGKARPEQNGRREKPRKGSPEANQTVAPWSNGQDTGFSILRRGFDSRRGYFLKARTAKNLRNTFHVFWSGFDSRISAAASSKTNVPCSWPDSPKGELRTVNPGIWVRFPFGPLITPDDGAPCAFNSAEEYLAFNQGAKGSNPLRRIPCICNSVGRVTVP